MYISFEITTEDKSAFLKHWEAKYDYPNEDKYTRNIGKPMTERSRQELFEWKNGSLLSGKKITSILENYPLTFVGNHCARYLDHKESGGAIWNIFYLHCLQQQKWPIFDQHTFRAMRYIQTGKIVEIGTKNEKKYEVYVNEYIPFFREFKADSDRQVDKALFSFGKFLKLAAKYI